MASADSPPTTQPAEQRPRTQPAPQVSESAASSGNRALYVGDLDIAATDAQLYEHFSSIGPVDSVKICRDHFTKVSLGYAYVNYCRHEEAATAIDLLNFSEINGKPIRIMFSNRDPTMRKSGYANVFIKNLDASIDNKALHVIFSHFGTILSCKLATDNNGHSKGYGFIQFDKEEAAQNAINTLDGMLINGKLVYVGIFIRRQDRIQAQELRKFTNVYVKNLPEATTDKDLKNIFGTYGPITSAVVMRDANGKSRCFGFVNFQNRVDATSAIENLNGRAVNGDKAWYVGKALKKSEREAELKAIHDRTARLKGANLYLKNLDDSIDDEKLKEMFSGFGTITSCKVMLEQGHSRGCGFVAFSTPEEANRAVTEMNGKMMGGKPLYVAIAQSKEERNARLQAYFAQRRASRPHPVPAFVPPRPAYFGPGKPAFLPAQPIPYAFPQPLPNILVPYPPRQPGPGGVVRHVGSSQQMARRQGMMGSMMPMAVNISGVPMAAIGVPRHGLIPIEQLPSALACASPEHQRTMLGEHLYPLVERLEPRFAGKVTGMLLELDRAEVLHLLESKTDLARIVAEAMVTLRAARAIA